MADIFKRTGWLVVVLCYVIGFSMVAAIPVSAQAAPAEGTVFIGDTEYSATLSQGSEDDVVLDSCDVTLSFFGFPATEQQATIIFQNITGTPGSLLNDPQLPQQFTFDGSGNIATLADEVTYPLVFSGPAVPGLGYHVYSMVTMRDNFTQTNNAKFLNFWIPEVCEQIAPPPPVEPETPTPGVVASAATTKPADAKPASLPATGSSDVTALAAFSIVAGFIAVTSLVAKKVFVKLS